MDDVSEPPMRMLESRYVLEEALGKGGMGKVYKARDVQTDEVVAVKILAPAAMKYPDWRSRFIAEAKAMTVLDHPHIAQIFHVGEHEGLLYFAMELTPYGSSYDMVRYGRAPDSPLWGLRIVFELLMALAAAHDNGIVHRDVKPANLLITERGVALTDFGLARLENLTVAHRTGTGERLGTRGYMAPEQQTDAKSVGPSADLYGAGATLYALLSRKNPADLSAALMDPEKILAAVPRPVWPVIIRSIQYKTEDRYADAEDMAFELAHARDGVAENFGHAAVADQWMDEFRRKRGGEKFEADLELWEEPTAVGIEEINRIAPADISELPPPPEPTIAPIPSSAWAAGAVIAASVLALAAWFAT